MNRWTCDRPDCQTVAVGVGGAVGLRAIGWFFESGPRLFCPAHRPDAVGDDCSHCIADILAFRYQDAIDSQLAHVPVLALDHAQHPTREADRA